MLTPNKINELVKNIMDKHTEPRFGLYPPQKKIMDYITKQIRCIANDSNTREVNKVKEMTNLLEGFLRYLNNTNKILKLDIEKVITYIYYPETEKTTLDNKDNLLVGNRGATVHVWHDAYLMANRKQIINCLIECKNVLYDKNNINEFMKTDRSNMPEEMQKKYEEMLSDFNR